MDKDFEKWLRQDELFEFYKSNPQQQADIYKDYQREKEYPKLEYIDEWVVWLGNNPELAEKYHPLLVQGLKEQIRKIPPFGIANIIQKLPEHFGTWKRDINALDGKYREKRIKEQIDLLNGVLNEYKYTTEIEQQAVESIRPYLAEQLEYWKSELRLKIKALFQFIEFLHSNIETFNQYNDLIKELEALKEEKNKLKPEQNHKDKLQYNKVQTELKSKFKTLQDNTVNLIKAKAKEFNVCNFDNEPDYNFNGIETEIRQLKKKFSDKDLPEIFKHKGKYLEYRRQTHKTFLSLQFFFDELDKIAKSLFDYFKDTEQNEFEAFETKIIEVNSSTEAAQRFNKQGQTKFIVPNLMGETQSRIQEKLADLIFFQIDIIADLELEGKTYKDVKQKNNDSILMPENWEQHKETFFTQRMATYKDSYTLAEKIKLELSGLEKLPVNKTDNQILKDRYKSYLEQKQALPPQLIVKQKPKPHGKLITFKNSETIDKIHSELKGFFPNKEAELLKTLQGEQLSELLLFPHNQNKFVEVFRRLKYNGFLLNKDTETRDWICTTFQFVKKGFAEPQPFNKSSVWDNLNKGKGEPTKKERICITEWLPYKSPFQLTRETENEKL